MNLDNRAEKRKYPRACFNWPVTLINDQGSMIFGRVRDISSGGVLVNTGTRLQIDEQIRLAIEISGFDDVISATGKVVRTFLLDVQRSSFVYALGICFTEMSAEDHRYFTGNLAPEWKEIPHIVKEKQKTLHTEKKNYILPAIILVVVMFIVFTQKYINKTKTTQVESSGQSYKKETEPIEIKPVNHIKINELIIINDAKMLRALPDSAE